MNDISKNPGKISPCPRCIEENNVYIVLENGKESDWVCPQCGHEYWNVTPPFLHNIGWKEKNERADEKRQATRQTEIKHQGSKKALPC